MKNKYLGGHIEYSFEMHVDHRQSINCQIDGSRIKEIIFNKSLPEDQFDYKWRLIIIFSEVSSIEEVDSVGVEIKDSIFNLLSFELKVGIYNIRQTGHGVIPKEGEGSQCHMIMPAMTCNGVMKSGGRKLSQTEINELGELLFKSEILNNNPLVSIFSYAVRAEEPIVQFMLLYLILYELYKDQKSVDKFIMEVSPNTVQIQSPYNRKLETVFTKLRNEITHRVDSSPEETRNGIISNMIGLKDIAHVAIMSQLRQ